MICVFCEGVALKIVVTGGAGFIGSAVIRQYINDTDHEVINLDALTYAGNLESLKNVDSSPRYHFEQADIRDIAAIQAVFDKYQPDAIMHLAAESHVDRSIDGPADFILTNIVGTYNLLDVAKRYWSSLQGEKKAAFRFHHVSTDEVYGDLEATGFFTEETPTTPVRRTPLVRPHPTTWYVPGIAPTACRWWSPTAPITTAATSSRKS